MSDVIIIFQDTKEQELKRFQFGSSRKARQWARQNNFSVRDAAKDGDTYTFTQDGDEIIPQTIDGVSRKSTLGDNSASKKRRRKDDTYVEPYVRTVADKLNRGEVTLEELTESGEWATGILPVSLIKWGDMINLLVKDLWLTVDQMMEVISNDVHTLKIFPRETPLTFVLDMKGEYPFLRKIKD